jgi:hypothetical protein
VVRNPHNNLPVGTKGAHVLRLRSEIREMHTDADRAVRASVGESVIKFPSPLTGQPPHQVMQGTGAFARGVYMTKVRKPPS